MMKSSHLSWHVQPVMKFIMQPVNSASRRWLLLHRLFKEMLRYVCAGQHLLVLLQLLLMRLLLLLELQLLLLMQLLSLLLLLLLLPLLLQDMIAQLPHVSDQCVSNSKTLPQHI